jgi:hypothetical protein
MAVLKAAQRNKLKTGTFALPSKRKYPIHDLAHAKAALSMAARSDTEGEESTVRAAVLKKYPQLAKGTTKSAPKKKPAKKAMAKKKRTKLPNWKK